ncbi:HlyD family efflux transporter periplasmic adaptor subunit [Thiolapillus sp.]|uniref:HlyD family efflux transporter periplasmic adaptor subunit n=1 Tax=Thiolapillus sp. TaxID=2017437 RepID=UPI003AF69CA7
MRQQAHRLIAPIDGIVQQLAVHTVGGIVTPAQQLMVVVPQSAKLEIEAFVDNKDIGFVQEGQAVAIKLDAFPFTKYGTLDGRIIDVSDDAVSDEKRGLVYKARVSLEQSVVQVGDKQVRLGPGMSASVEIKTGQRRLIEFFR